MQSRRDALALLASFPWAGNAFAQAEDWRRAYPELVLSVTPAENSGGVIDRFAPFAEYLSRTLGVKVTIRIGRESCKNDIGRIHGIEILSQELVHNLCIGRF